MNRPYLVVVDQATSAQLESVHVAMKALAGNWWHNAANVWIVMSDQEHGVVRDKAVEAVRAKKGIPRVLVLRLPTENSDRHWAATGLAENGNDWLWRTYFGQEPPSASTK